MFFEILGGFEWKGFVFASFLCAVRDLLPRSVVFYYSAAGGRTRWVFGVSGI
jgi:hypothetical protein